MTARYKFQLKGLEEYLEKIADSGSNVDKAADNALIAGGDVIVNEMQDLVPVLSGNLKRHLARQEPKQEGNYHSLEVGMPANADAETARYGNVMEYGSTSVQAQPYIRPAFDKTGPAVRRAEVESLKEEGIL
jgi:HK97 gp10 family phage protein